jgi:hypothetical protein
MGERPGATLHLRFLENGRRIRPQDLPSRIGKLPARANLADQVEMMIALIDEIDGDPNLEDGDEDCCAASDDNLAGNFAISAYDIDGGERDGSYTEWHTRGRHKQALGGSEPFDRMGEDGEDDDAKEDDNQDYEHDGREPEEA